MTRLIAILLPLVLVGALEARNSPQSDKPLTNQDVIKLMKLGLSVEVIIKKVEDSPGAYDLSIDGLTSLAQNRVPNEVIKAMQAAGTRQERKPPSSHSAGSSSASAPIGSAATPTSGRSTPYPMPPDKGAYLWDGSDLHLLYQSTVPSAGTNFWRSMTPFVKKKFELQLVGAYAKAHFENQQPTILASGLGEVIPGIPAYRLLYVKTGGMLKDRRIVGTYDVGGFFGSIRMVDNEVECDVRKVGEGIYSIAPLKPLKDGEYGLVQVPKLADLSSRPSFAPPIWDFGIYAEGRPPEKKN
jgi:hypothetical protein